MLWLWFQINCAKLIWPSFISKSQTTSKAASNSSQFWRKLFSLISTVPVKHMPAIKPHQTQRTANLQTIIVFLSISISEFAFRPNPNQRKGFPHNPGANSVGNSSPSLPPLSHLISRWIFHCIFPEILVRSRAISALHTTSRVGKELIQDSCGSNLPLLWSRIFWKVFHLTCFLLSLSREVGLFARGARDVSWQLGFQPSQWMVALIWHKYCDLCGLGGGEIFGMIDGNLLKGFFFTWAFFIVLEEWVEIEAFSYSDGKSNRWRVGRKCDGKPFPEEVLEWQGRKEFYLWGLFRINDIFFKSL